MKAVTSELDATKRQLEQLQADNARWQSVCSKMKIHLDQLREQQTTEASGISDQDRDSDEEEGDSGESLKELTIVM